MNAREKHTVVVILSIIATLCLSGCRLTSGPTSSDSDSRGCTIFTVSQGDRVFFGGNGDWINMDGNYYWVDPGDETHYGAIFFGKPDNVQQGFNEKGLAYDSNGLPAAPVTDHPGREPAYGGHNSYFIHILQACATVEEVIAWVQAHQWHESMHYQMHFADALGNAVVISAGPDGRVAFTRKPAGDGFLVSTNFNQANRNNGSYPCWRYDRARDRLQEIIHSGTLTPERAASVLDAVHVESTTVWTVMSVLGNLPQGLVYVYLFHQFDAPIVLNVAHEIARQPAPGPLADLFPPETVAQADRAYQRLASRGTRCAAVGWVWIGLVVTSLAAFLLLSKRHRTVVQGEHRDVNMTREPLQWQWLAFWARVIVVFGPVGLLAWGVVCHFWRGRRSASVLAETVGDLIPSVVGIVGALWLLVLLSEISQNVLLQLSIFCGLPFLIGILFYQAPFLALATQSGYLRTLWQRLPAALISTNLSLAGLFAVVLPTTKWHLEFCGFGDWTVLSWWAIAALGALGGGLPLAGYHSWAVRHGFVAWSALPGNVSKPGKDEWTIRSSPLRRIWWWTIVSFAVLVVGIALGAMGSQIAAEIAQP